MGILKQHWTSPRLTRWFVAAYLGWILLGSVWSWYRHCDVNGAAPARVVFIHTTSERVEANGHVTIHEYVSNPHKCRFVGDVHLTVHAEASKLLKLSLEFRNVGPDGRMTVRSHAGATEQVISPLSSHTVGVSIPLSDGEQIIELSFDQGDVQYSISRLELADNDNDTAQNRILTSRSWIPYFKRGGVQFSVGAGWFLPLPDLTSERPFTHTARYAYLLLGAEQPGDYELVFPWLRSTREYGQPSLLLDGKDLSPTEATPGPPESRTRVRLHLEREHVLSVRLNDRIVSPVSRWEHFDSRFLGYQVPWNLLKIHRIE